MITPSLSLFLSLKKNLITKNKQAKTEFHESFELPVWTGEVKVNDISVIILVYRRRDSCDAPKDATKSLCNLNLRFSFSFSLIQNVKSNLTLSSVQILYLRKFSFLTS